MKDPKPAAEALRKKNHHDEKRAEKVGSMAKVKEGREAGRNCGFVHSFRDRAEVIRPKFIERICLSRRTDGKGMKGRLMRCIN